MSDECSALITQFYIPRYEIQVSNDIVTIEVDGKPLPARKGQMLIQVTDANDIYVPRFCYHHKLSIAANCRMCLVDVEKAPKPLPACATPVVEGMKVHTRSKRAIDAQKAVMEFLLINHPLDCPICDQGGECELQDLAMGYGRDISRYQEKKRVVRDKDIGSLVQTDMTRCIHCTRCVRFGEEIAGLRELGATGRGEHMEIGTYIEKSMVSELSGNVIDICPVGALTSKPFRYSARAWEMVQRNSVAPHDGVGSNIHVHIKDDRIMRVVPAENEAINEVWLSDRDRFSYEGLYSADRLAVPMIRDDGAWQEADWETALRFVKDRMAAAIRASGAGSLGALASPSATLEELYLLQKFMRGLGSPHIDHRLRQRDFSDQDSAPLFPWLGQAINELETRDAVLLIGSNVRKEQPLINHRLRKAALRGGKVLVVNACDYDFNFSPAAKLIVPPGEMIEALAGIARSLAREGGGGADEAVLNAIENVSVTDEQEKIGRLLKDAEQGTVLLGNLATAHPQFSSIRTLAGNIARLADVKIGYLSEAANTAGSWLAGVLPHRLPGGMPAPITGKNAWSMIDEPLRAYVILGIEPELDCWDGYRALQAMRAADFTVCLTAYQSDVMKDYADVMLPIALFAETAGTFVNNEGRMQGFDAVVSPPREARPAWKVLRVLGNRFDLPGFDYSQAHAIREELRTLIEDLSPDNDGKWQATVSLETGGNGIQRIADIPMNAIDPLVRRARALQQTVDVADGAVHFNCRLARQIGLANGGMVTLEHDDRRVELPAVIDDRVADNCVLIHAAHPVHARFGPWHGELVLVREG